MCLMPLGQLQGTHVRGDDAYVYQALEHPECDIRLVRFKSRRLDHHGESIPESANSKFDPVNLELELKTFDLNACPDYVALSYTWGAEYPKHIVMLNDYRTSIRGNLYDFLLAAKQNSWLQESSQQRWLWVDQLCLNQEDVPERNSQVRRMSNIYSEAAEVYIWLGNLGGNGDRAMADVPKGTASDFKEFSACAKPVKYPEFWENPYWSRVWIMQEIQLARKFALLCSGSRISWERLRSCAYRRCLPYQYFGGHSIFHHRIKREHKHTHLPLEVVLSDSVSGQCHDVCDHVYGIMAMIPPSDRIPTDYSKSVEEVFTVVLNKALADDLFPNDNHELICNIMNLAVEMGLLGPLGRDYPYKLCTQESNYQDLLPVVLDLVLGSEAPPSIEDALLYRRKSFDGPEAGIATRAGRRLKRQNVTDLEVHERLLFYTAILEARSDWTRN